MNTREFKFIKQEKIPLEQLRFQSIPVKYNGITHIVGGDFIKDSPHVKLLQLYSEKGRNYDMLMKSEYAEMYLRWNSIGFVRSDGSDRDKKYIKFKIDNIIDVYESIKKNGFNEKSSIEVLENPFWQTRYGISVGHDGIEIWVGHHRCACCFVLGISAINSKIYRDKKQGSCKFKRFDKYFRNLNND